MAAAYVYTERLIAETGSTLPKAVTVPAGRRIVVRSVSLVNRHTAANAMFCYGAGHDICSASVPAQTQVQISGLYVALYAGEQLGVQVVTGPGSIVVGGYVFSDPSGPIMPKAALDQNRLELGGQLPAAD